MKQIRLAAFAAAATSAAVLAAADSPRPSPAESAVVSDGKPACVRCVPMPDVDKVELEGEYPGHLQDVCRDDAGFLYWSHTHYILKTDMRGKVLVKAAVEGHNAGCEVKDGVLYVAVCPLQNKTGGQTTPECRLQINEYDAETLALRSKHVLPVNDRAGSLAILEDGSFVVGCLRPKDILPSQARFHHVGRDFSLKSTHLLDNVNVRLGIEVIKRRGDTLFMMLCGSPTVKVDAKTFAETGRLEYRGGQTGLIFDGDYYWRGYIRQPEGSKVWKSWIKRCRVEDFMREPSPSESAGGKGGEG